VLETVAAGSVPSEQLAPGTAIKVMTGAPVPAGTGAVVKIEDVRRQGDTIELLHPSAETNLCRQGEDVRRGDRVLPAGTRLSALGVANLVGCGIGEVEVFRRVRLAILSTGDEIADHPRDLRPGMIMNTNGPLLTALAARHGLEVVWRQSVRDDRAATATAVRAALERADMVVLSGGVSVGDFDYVTPALEDAGLAVHFNSVAIKPGRPTTYASGGGKAAFGLPGNPVSVYLMFHLFVLHAAARLTGGTSPVREVGMILAGGFRRRKTERMEYVPCRIREDGLLEAVAFHGSAHLMALGGADGFFIVPQGAATIEPGTPVRFLRIGAAGA
jgi:molybdopterin molybdotransferase